MDRYPYEWTDRWMDGRLLNSARQSTPNEHKMIHSILSSIIFFNFWTQVIRNCTYYSFGYANFRFKTPFRISTKIRSSSLDKLNLYSYFVRSVEKLLRIYEFDWILWLFFALEIEQRSSISIKIGRSLQRKSGIVIETL